MGLTLPTEAFGDAADATAAGASTELMTLADLAKERAAWNRLLQRAAYVNPFHGPDVLIAHAVAGLAGPDLRAIAVRRGAEFNAVLPFRRAGGRIGARRCHLSWTHPSVSINGTPLVQRDRLQASVDALLDGMAAVSGPRLWRFPLLSLGSAVGQALLDHARGRRWPFAVVSSFERAILERRRERDGDAGAHPSASRRRAMRRQMRRLSELGHVSFESHADVPGLAGSATEFLALEAAGWKGARGTALAGSAATADLARRLFSQSDGSVVSRADLLRLDERPIAVSLALVCGGTAFLLKTAYDENLRAYAPGLMLEAEIIRAFHETRFADRLDSCSLAGCVLEEFFPDREQIGDLVLAADPGVTQSALAALVRQERVRLAARDKAKAWYWKLIDLKGGR